MLISVMDCSAVTRVPRAMVYGCTFHTRPTLHEIRQPYPHLSILVTEQRSKCDTHNEGC